MLASSRSILSSPISGLAARATTSFVGGTPLTTSSTLQQSSSFSIKATKSDPSKNVVVVDGVRLPFAMTSTIYEDQLAVDLQRLAYQGLITKTALDKKDVDYFLAGTVIQEVKTSNIAREAAINAGFPSSIGAHTVAMVSCIKLYFVTCTYISYTYISNIHYYRHASHLVLPSLVLQRKS